MSDACVPISKLAECITETCREVAAANLVAPILGHVGDGNFHAIFLVDPTDADEMDRAQRVNDRMIERVLAVGGTCTGEHGIGIGKLSTLRDQHGEGVAVMQSIKDSLDPEGLLNPGKVLA